MNDISHVQLYDDLRLEIDKLQRRQQSVTEFVATYYSQHADSEDTPDTPWGQVVEWVASAGNLLEDVAQEAKSRGDQIAEWYDILDEAAEALHLEIQNQRDQARQLRGTQGEPDFAFLRLAFARFVDRHLERPTVADGRTA